MHPQRPSYSSQPHVVRAVKPESGPLPVGNFKDHAMREYYPEWKETGNLGMEYGHAPEPKQHWGDPAPVMSELEKGSREKRSREYWNEGRADAKVIGTQLPIPEVPAEWHHDYEWRTWRDAVRKLRDSLRCASCYSTKPKEGLRVMMTCSRCRQVKYCSVACQKKDFKERHKAVCKPCAPKPFTGDRKADVPACGICGKRPCACAELAKTHPSRDRGCE